MVDEMEKRYASMLALETRNIQEFNETIRTRSQSEFEKFTGAWQPFPYVVFLIDEFADMVLTLGKEAEELITRLAQKARAAGIHLVIATQRPSVDVVTGLIKANITTRIAFSVASLVDSRTILDMAGAEKLLGRGDMLYLSAEIQKPKRLQGAYASDSEIKAVIEHLKAHGQPEYLEEVTERPQGSERDFAGSYAHDSEESDPLLTPATDVIARAGKASASLLQRRLKIGYARAARILDLLEARGVVGPADGSKPREVLLSRPPEDATLEDEGDFSRSDANGSGDDQSPAA
jgi:S-DNA-T family DNA segregation ATPase FtsK/SpoIIIE